MRVTARPNYPHVTRDMAQPRFQNRLVAVMDHIPIYSFQGRARLAADAGVSRAAISRLVAGKTSPSFAVTVAITAALERRLGRRLDPRELVSFDGRYPTASVCDLCGCRGCTLEGSRGGERVLRPLPRADRSACLSSRSGRHPTERAP